MPLAAETLHVIGAHLVHDNDYHQFRRPRGLFFSRCGLRGSQCGRCATASLGEVNDTAASAIVAAASLRCDNFWGDISRLKPSIAI